MLKSVDSETRPRQSVVRSRGKSGPETSRVSGFSIFLYLFVYPVLCFLASFQITKILKSDSSSGIDYLVKYHHLFTTTDPTKETLLFSYNPLDSLLQVGPTCGLVCLAQAKRFIQPDSEPWHEDTLLAEAKRMGLSNYGEMFAAAGMEQMAREVLGLNATTWTCMETNRKQIIESLLEGAAVLIPYDVGYDSGPALYNGGRAHWCICTGFAFRVQLNQLGNYDVLKGNHVDLKSIELPTSDLFNLLDRQIGLSLFCKQGHSKSLKVFNFESLVQSNKNLFIPRNDRVYKIPDEGIGQSLRDKFVVIT